MTSFKPNHLPKAQPADTITLALGPQHRNWGLGERANVQSIATASHAHSFMYHLLTALPLLWLS